MSVDQASQWIRYFLRQFVLLHDREELFPRWHELVVQHEVKGVRSHDARLVAAMLPMAFPGC
jgi:hypothetical protein